MPFPDRRRSPRRGEDLPRRRWPDILVSMVLGMATAVVVQTLRHQQEGPRPVQLAVDTAHAASLPPRAADPEAGNAAPPFDLHVLQQWTEQARELTPATVALDERAFERWLPRLERLERALDRTDLPSSQRAQLREIHQTLVATGVVPPRPAGSKRPALPGS